MTPEADYIIRKIEPFIIIIITPRNIYRFSPDKALLLDENAPFLRKTDAWLKKKK